MKHDSLPWASAPPDHVLLFPSKWSRVVKSSCVSLTLTLMGDLLLCLLSGTQCLGLRYQKHQYLLREHSVADTSGAKSRPQSNRVSRLRNPQQRPRQQLSLSAVNQQAGAHLLPPLCGPPRGEIPGFPTRGAPVGHSAAVALRAGTSAKTIRFSGRDQIRFLTS